MKQFIDKLIKRLEEESGDMQENMVKSTSNSMANFCSGACGAYNKTIAIVKELAEETEKDPNWQTTRNYLDVKYFSKIRELSAKYNYPCENVPINFDWVFGLIDKIETQLAEEYNNDFCEWEKGSSGYVGYPAYYSKCCTTNSNGLEMQTHIISDWKFCPYCGKKIKVVPYQPKGE